MTPVQRAVYAYVLSMVGRTEVADDIVQEVNLALWRKFEQNQEIRNPRALAFELARYEVMTWRQRHRRDKLRFGSDVIELLSVEAAPDEAWCDRAHDLLEHCMDRLPLDSRQLIELRYLQAPGPSIGSLAQQMGGSVASISQKLYRIREALARCIQGAMAREARQ